MRLRKDLFGQLGARANADEMGVGNGLLQLLFRQRAGVVLDVGVTGCLQCVNGGLVYALEQQELDLAFVQRGVGHGVSYPGADIGKSEQATLVTDDRRGLFRKSRMLA